PVPGGVDKAPVRVTVHARYVIAQGRFYQVLAGVVDGRPGQADVDRFFDSFRVEPAGDDIAPPEPPNKLNPPPKKDPDRPRPGDRPAEVVKPVKPKEPGAELAPFEGRSELLELTVSPKGDLLAAAGRDGSVTVWDAATGKERA